MLAACASSPSSTLGELPRTPQASTQQLLEKADQSDPEQAVQLRLAAADQSIQQGNHAQARSILEKVQLDTLKPAQQIFALTLQAEIALADRSEEHTSELQSLMRISYAVFCLKKKKTIRQKKT